jgi:hypothetical protein
MSLLAEVHQTLFDGIEQETRLPNSFLKRIYAPRDFPETHDERHPAFSERTVCAALRVAVLSHLFATTWFFQCKLVGSVPGVVV